VWRTVRVCLPQLVERRGYALVISSLAAVVHIPGNAAYSAAKAGVEAFANSLRAEVRHLGVGVGVAHPTWIATDMVDSADKHPVFGALRTSTPGLLSKTYPLSVAVDLLDEGIARRARAIHVPGWVGVLKLVRALIPRVVELASRSFMPAADKAAIEDIAKRGGQEASIVGPGGRADLESRR
jgi:short-subunit dehydrogenase